MTSPYENGQNTNQNDNTIFSLGSLINRTNERRKSINGSFALDNSKLDQSSAFFDKSRNCLEFDDYFENDGIENEEDDDENKEIYTGQYCF
jgi:hypothetical protein